MGKCAAGSGGSVWQGVGECADRSECVTGSGGVWLVVKECVAGSEGVCGR